MRQCGRCDEDTPTLALKPKHLSDLKAIELVYGPPEVIRSHEDFRPYQVWMEQSIIDLPGILLAAEMGLGKTACVLKAIRRLLDAGTISKVLIVAPLLVAEETWPEEIAKWDFARSLTYRVATGTLKQRKDSFHASGPVDITIINRENLRWLQEWIGVRRWPFDMIVYDEASRLKGGKKRVRSKVKGQKGDLTELGVIESVRPRTKKFVGLTGTPSPNGIIDLWGPMYAVDKGKRLGTDRKSVV